MLSFSDIVFRYFDMMLLSIRFKLNFWHLDKTVTGIFSISVVANIAPKLSMLFQESMLKGDYTKALTYQDILLPLHRAAFSEPNPAPTKYALSLLGRCSNEVRSPLCEISSETEDKIRLALVHAGLIS